MAERIVWVVAVLVVGGAAFLGGQQVGRQAAMATRVQAQQELAAQGGAGQATGEGVPAGQGQPGPAGAGGGQAVAGTVARVEGDRLVITAADGAEVTITLAEGGAVRRQVVGQLGELRPGEQVLAFGARDGAAMTATIVQVGGGSGRGAPPAP